jgi:RimJ/RimL family protein N-acetyltransferase
MKLIPIKQRIEDNGEFTNIEFFKEILSMTVDFYNRVGYCAPWIGYLVEENRKFVGSGGFKGAPVDGKVEIAYGTFEPYQGKGIGTEICKLLVDLALKTQPDIRITARTLRTKNFSTSILKKNGFSFTGTVHDPEDGDVWEWELMKSADGLHLRA